MEIIAALSLVILIILVVYILYFFFSYGEEKIEHGIKNNDEVKKLEKVVSPTFVLTRIEKPFYYTLKELYPDHIILTQVSFSAIVKTSDVSLRNQYNRARVDILIVSEDFTPIVVAELDDKSHLNEKNKKRDELRDNILSAAGIPTIRFFGIPSKEEIKAEIDIVLRQFEHREKLPTYKRTP